MQAFRLDDINAPAQQSLQIADQTAWKESRVPRTGFDEQIHVALFRGFSANNRTKHADIVRAVFGGKAQNIGAVPAKELVCAHDA